MWVRVDYRGRQDGWILTANKRGRSLVPVDGDDLSDAARSFDAQEARYAAEVAAAATPSADDDDDRPLTGAKPAASAVEAEDRPLDTGGGGKGSWAPPSEFPPGHEESPVSEGTAAVARAGVEGEVEKENASGMIGSSGSVRYMRALGYVLGVFAAVSVTVTVTNIKAGAVEVYYSLVTMTKRKAKHRK